jgi:putative hydrolase of the HAD superfamily
MKKYKVMVFDLGNTILKFDHNIAVRKIANLFRLDSRALYDAFFDSDLTRAFEKGLIPPKDFHRKISERFSFSLPFEDFAAIWNDIFWEDELSCELARELKRSYRLYLLSNINRMHFEYIMERFDIIDIFDEIIASYAVGAMKPEKAIYDDVIRRAGGDKDSLFYIDDRQDLIDEAKLLGIDSIRYEGAEKLREEMSSRGIL